MSRERKEMKNKGGKRRLSFSFFGPYKRFTHRRKCVVKDASLQKENNIRKKKKETGRTLVSGAACKWWQNCFPSRCPPQHSTRRISRGAGHGVSKHNFTISVKTPLFFYFNFHNFFFFLLLCLRECFCARPTCEYTHTHKKGKSRILTQREHFLFRTHVLKGTCTTSLATSLAKSMKSVNVSADETNSTNSNSKKKKRRKPM